MTTADTFGFEMEPEDTDAIPWSAFDRAPERPRPPAAVVRLGRTPRRGDLPAAVVEDLGRLLGEALVAQFRADAERMDASRPGRTRRDDPLDRPDPLDRTARGER